MKKCQTFVNLNQARCRFNPTGTSFDFAGTEMNGSKKINKTY